MSDMNGRSLLEITSSRRFSNVIVPSLGLIRNLPTTSPSRCSHTIYHHAYGSRYLASTALLLGIILIAKAMESPKTTLKALAPMVDRESSQASEHAPEDRVWRLVNLLQTQNRTVICHEATASLTLLANPYDANGRMTELPSNTTENDRY
jgi:hypothetical protein